MLIFQTPARAARALTDAPDMARIAVGRITAPSAAIATQNPAENPPEAKPVEKNVRLRRAPTPYPTRQFPGAPR